MNVATQSLSAELRARRHHLRSAHLELHEGHVVSTYIPTGRGLEVLHRIARAMLAGDTGRAWSLTGPYGAGKSSFALFVHALFGPDGDRARVVAEAALKTAEPELLSLIQDSCRKFGATKRGFIRAVATAQRESVNDTALRALTVGAHGYWRGRIPADVANALADANHECTPRTLGRALEALSVHAPVLIELDEFGKNLEYFASNTAEADLFVLQELAERCTGDSGLPALLVTLQHMNFDDYVRGASALQRREWGKVQGRFEDITFVESAEQSLRLVAGAFEPPVKDSVLHPMVNSWAASEAQECERLGLARFLPGGAAALASCYPLHPITLLTLPEMCARFGQYGRTLFSFLTGREPYSVAEFLDNYNIEYPLPTVGLDCLYDFFADSVASSGSRHASRLAEIHTTIREITGLTDEQRAILKVVGILNSLSQGGPLRASLPIIKYALSASGPVVIADVHTIIAELEKRGILTYRTFADEYRLWQGSDLDLAALVEQAREDLTLASPAELLAGQHSLAPAIAGKHSQRVGMLRYFETVLADASTRFVVGPGVDDPADGLLVYFLGTPDEAVELSVRQGSKPVVVATTVGYSAIVEAVFELASVLHVLDRPDVIADRVAKRELQDRAADARRRLLERVSEHLSPTSPGVQFRVSGAEEVLPVGRGLSSLLSRVCDEVYCASPEIANEMLGRRSLTSQAAKARRELLIAMVEHHDKEWLGMEGFGPEKAMYAALLRYPRIHREMGNGLFGYHQPGRGSMNTVWGTMTQMVDRSTNEKLSLDILYKRLMEPPIGLKEGPIPVLLTALLMHRVDDVAIYQEGTYQPTITSDLLERLIKSPSRFSVKHFKLTNERIRFIDAVAQAVGNITGWAPSPNRRKGVPARNGTLLGVTGPLLAVIRNLPSYTMRTSSLSESARAVRDAVLEAREPDQLIFAALPRAMGMDDLGSKAGSSQTEFADFSVRLEAALVELTDTYAVMLRKCLDLLATELRIPGRNTPEMRLGLQSRSHGLTDALLEPHLRSFVLLATNTDLDDDAWLEAVLNNIAGRPAAGWRDEDARRFADQLHSIASSFRRYQALHYEALAQNGRTRLAAHRVTVTSPDGTEHSDIVWVDDETRPQLQDAVDQALLAAERLLGSRGAGALLAVLARTVVGTEHDGNAPVEPATPQRKVRDV